MEHIAVDVPDRQQVGVMPLVVFHEVAEMDFMGFESGKAVPLLFRQFQAALRQGVFPLGIGMPHVHRAVTDAGVGRTALPEYAIRMQSAPPLAPLCGAVLPRCC